VGFSPRGDVAVTTNDSGQVTVWDPKSGNVQNAFTGHENKTLGLAFSADGKRLFTSSLDGAIFEWDISGEQRFGRPFQVPGVDSAQPSANSSSTIPLTPPLALAPDGSRLATRIGADSVGVFSMRTLARIGSFAANKGGPIDTITWSPRGDVLAISSPNGRVQLWSVRGQPHLVRTLALRPVNKQPVPVNAVAFSPGGDLVAAVAANQMPSGGNPPAGLAAVWETASGKLLWQRVHRAGPADALAFSHDGRRLAVSYELGLHGGENKVVNPTNGRVERTLRPLDGFSESLAFAPDGTLATGGWSGIVQLWNPSTGKHLGHPVLALPAPVATISFDPSGAEFVTGGGPAFTKLWDTKTLQQLGAAFPGSPGQWGNAQFTRDGSKLVTLYKDGHGTVWPGTLDAWKAHACRVAGRNLTKEEWSRYVTGRSYARTCP